MLDDRDDVTGLYGTTGNRYNWRWRVQKFWTLPSCSVSSNSVSAKYGTVQHTGNRYFASTLKLRSWQLRWVGASAQMFASLLRLRKCVAVKHKFKLGTQRTCKVWGVVLCALAKSEEWSSAHLLSPRRLPLAVTNELVPGPEMIKWSQLKTCCRIHGYELWSKYAACLLKSYTFV